MVRTRLGRHVLCGDGACLERRRREAVERERAAEAERRAASMATAEGQTTAGIPAQYHGACFADFPSLQPDLAWFFGADRPGLLTLIGACGRGKTRVGYALLRRSVIEGRPCVLRHAPTMLIEMSERRDGQAKQLREMPGLLVLDDVLAEDPAAQHLRLLSGIVHAREAWGRPTLLTTNVPIEDVSAISERLASRMAGGLVLQLEGADRRLARSGD